MITTTQRRQYLTAITAYARWCVQEGRPYRHPDATASSVGTKYVYLRTRQERLACYDVALGRILSG